MIILDPEVYSVIGQGIKYSVDAVKPTIGPLGRNIAYDPKMDVPYIVNNGREIIKRVNFIDDKALMVGVDTVKQAMEKTYWAAGDGSVATAIIIQRLWDEGMKNIAAGADPMALGRGIKKAADCAVSELEKLTDKAKKEDVRGLALCAAGGRDDVADIVCDIYDHIGPNGYVTVEDSQMAETHVSYFKGVRWEKGFQGFWEIDSVTQENVKILLINRIVNRFEELAPVIKEARDKNTPLLIIARELKDDVINALHYVRDNGGVDVMGVIAPGYGEVRDTNMASFAAMFEGTVFDDMMTEVQDMKLSDCGHADKVIISKKETIIQGIPNPDDPEVVARRQRLYDDLDHIKDENERYRIEQMLTPLAGDTASVLVGGVMEMEMFERKYLVENSIHNTYNALKNGMLPGGGKGYILAVPAVRSFAEGLEKDEKTGALIFADALTAPAFQISENAGLDGKHSVESMLAEKKKYNGINVFTGAMEDMKKSGILDSAAVIKSAVITAVSSISTTLSVAACVVARDPEKEEYM